MAKDKTVAENPVQPVKLIVAGVLGLVAACVFVWAAADRDNWAYAMLGIPAVYFGVRYLLVGVISLKK